MFNLVARSSRASFITCQNIKSENSVPIILRTISSTYRLASHGQDKALTKMFALEKQRKTRRRIQAKEFSQFFFSSSFTRKVKVLSDIMRFCSEALTKRIIQHNLPVK